MKDVLIIGGGVAGIQAALDLAERGIHVYMVEKEPSIGGRMALLDKTMSTNDCSICILAPKMNECFAHPNIDILEYSEVIGIDGKEGDFKVEVRRKAKYVDSSKCTGCGDCMEKCPTEVPNKFNSYLDKRRAIYLPFPQSVPRKATIDADYCLKLTKNRCGLCQKTCKAEAINYDDKDKIVELNVGAIIVAIGLSLYEPKDMKEYGYGIYDNVHTWMEYERLINAAGPTHGHLHCSPDGRRPRKIAFIQCVGSRDVKRCQWCSSLCCMVSIKSAMLAYEHYGDIDIESYIFYSDLRIFSKRFYEYSKRGEKDYNIKYIHGRPGEIKEDKKTKNLIIYYDDEREGKVKELEVEMVILATPIMAAEDTKKLASILGIETDEYGFIKVRDYLTNPVETAKPGIFVAGCCERPKDITESVIQASAAAAKAAEIVMAEVV
ncbi:MAG: CoB--CoM heterodisulfide reductase iron-sulfur subunit A family protein [Thermoplasmata archaeon]|nr:MAG: CoB--CoM heterodisulfide reductase iron-sulfur subunit A family protein [Thermoplasmata archaeon]